MTPEEHLLSLLNPIAKKHGQEKANEVSNALGRCMAALYMLDEDILVVETANILLSVVKEATKNSTNQHT